jgi:hypothetical protein
VDLERRFRTRIMTQGFAGFFAAMMRIDRFMPEETRPVFSTV